MQSITPRRSPPPFPPPCASSPNALRRPSPSSPSPSPQARQAPPKSPLCRPRRRLLTEGEGDPNLLTLGEAVVRPLDFGEHEGALGGIPEAGRKCCEQKIFPLIGVHAPKIWNATVSMAVLLRKDGEDRLESCSSDTLVKNVASILHRRRGIFSRGRTLTIWTSSDFLNAQRTPTTAGTVTAVLHLCKAPTHSKSCEDVPGRRLLRQDFRSFSLFDSCQAGLNGRVAHCRQRRGIGSRS